MTTMTRALVTGVWAALLSATLAAQVPTPSPPGAAGAARLAETTRAVTLPLAEYNRLLDLASRPAPTVVGPPVGAVLTRAELRVRVERNAVHGAFVLSGETLREGLHRVDLLTGSTLVNGTVSGRPLPLVAEGHTPAALIQGTGPFSLTLDWGAPVVFQPGRASFSLPVPPAGTARATIDVPGDHADVHLSRGLVTRRSTANGRTLVEVTLQPGEAADVWWSMRDSAPVAAAREVRTVADVLTLVTLGDSDVRMAALVDVTVVQGEPRTIRLHLPSGYDVTSITGPSLDTASDPREQSVVLTVTDPTLRKHQFLVALERPHGAGSFSLETSLPTLPDAQRERGEIAIEGIGTLELETTEREGTHRMDVRELNQALSLMARAPMLAAFRYQRGAATVPGLSLNVKRFADAGVLAAVADHGSATTMVTSEGRALTEITLTVRNRAQPFLKVTLPVGATLASVEVAGAPAKPVLGADGTRIPLLRPGFRPDGPYRVSFVYLHGGAPLTKRGDLRMLLPKMDLPIGIVYWEVFVPETYSVKVVDGNVIEWKTIVRAARSPGFEGAPAASPVSAPSEIHGSGSGGSAQLSGRIADSTGAALTGVTVVVSAPGFSRSAVTAADGSYSLMGLPTGLVNVSASLMGLTPLSTSIRLDSPPRRLDLTLEVGKLTEAVEAGVKATPVDAASSLVTPTFRMDRDDPPPPVVQRPQPPSQNVLNLQRRAAGVLPIRVDVPRAGASHTFVKPLVVDQDTTVTLRYKRR